MNIEWAPLPRAWTYGVFEYPDINNLTHEAYTSSAVFQVEVNSEDMFGYWSWQEDGMSAAHYELWCAAQAVSNPMVYITEILQKLFPLGFSQDGDEDEDYDDYDDEDWTP